MKIVFIVPRYHTNQYEVINILKKNNHSISIHALITGPTEDHSLIRPTLLKICFISSMIIKLFGEGGANRPRMFPSPIKYYFLLKNEYADVVVIRRPNTFFSIMAAFYARVLKIKIIFYEQNILHKKYSIIRKIIYKSILYLFKANWYTPLKGDPNKFPYKPNNMYFIPFPVQSEHNNLNKVINYPIQLLMVAKYQERKNHVLLLKAISKIKNKYNINLTMVGECVTNDQIQYKNKIIKFVNDNNLNKIVRYIDNVKYISMNKLYLSHDIFILPAKFEPASISILEALSYGLPSICSDTCGTRFYIHEEINGMIFKCNDLNDLINKLIYLISNIINLNKMKINAVNISNSETSRSNFYNAFVKICEK